MTNAPMAALLWWAGLLVSSGLIVQLGTTLWIHPLSFVTFLLVTCPLVMVGMLVYLWALVAREPFERDSH